MKFGRPFMQMKHTYSFFPIKRGETVRPLQKCWIEFGHCIQYFCSAGIFKNFIFSVAADLVCWFA